MTRIYMKRGDKQSNRLDAMDIRADGIEDRANKMDERMDSMSAVQAAAYTCHIWLMTLFKNKKS